MDKLLYFKSKYCGQCRKYLPIVEQLETDFPDIQFEKIDIDENKELVEKYQITTLPTIILTKDNRILGKIQGMIPKSKLVQKLKK